MNHGVAKVFACGMVSLLTLGVAGCLGSDTDAEQTESGVSEDSDKLIGSYRKPTQGTITCNPFQGDPCAHGADCAWDIANSRGTPIIATTGGTITARHTAIPGCQNHCEDFNGGNYVIERGDDGLEIMYFHLDSIAGNVVQGGRIEPGQLIGTMGDSGFAFGVHLHFEVRHSFGSPLSGAECSAIGNQLANTRVPRAGERSNGSVNQSMASTYSALGGKPGDADVSQSGGFVHPWPDTTGCETQNFSGTKKSDGSVDTGSAGILQWNPRTGKSFWVRGQVFKQYVGMNTVGLGCAISDEEPFADAGGVTGYRQRFEHGTVTWDHVIR